MFVVFFAVGFTLVCGSLIQTASVSVSNFYVRKSTTVLVSINLPSGIPENGQLIVVFPEDLFIDSNVFCSVDQGVKNKNNAVCTVLGQSIVITKCFPTISGNLIVSFYKIPTPDYALVTESFEIYSLYDNLVIDSLDNGLYVEFFPVIMKNAEVFVDEEQVWTVIFESSYEVSQVVMELPERNAYLGDDDLEESEYCENVRCISVSSKDYLDFELSDECRCVNRNLNVFGKSDGGKSIFQVLMKAPPSTDLLTGFKIFSTGNKGNIEYYELNVTSKYQGQLNISSQSTSQELNTNASYLLSMVCENPIPVNGKISMQFSSFSIENVEIFGIFGLEFVTEYEILEENIKIFNSFLEFINSGTEIIVLINNLKNPETSNSGQIKISILTNTDGILCSGVINFSILPHWLDVELMIENTEINQYSEYVFSIESDYFVFGYIVSIEFPQELDIREVKCGKDFQCLLDGSTLIVYEYLEFESKLDVLIQNVRNPSTTQSTGVFIVSLYTSIEDLNKICENSDIFVLPSSGAIEATVKSGSELVGALATYSFQVILTNSVPETGELLIIFPDNIEITSLSACYSFQNLPLSTNCEFNSNSITLTNLFSDNFHQNFQFKVTNIQNPISSCTSESFIIKSLSNSYTIDQITTGLEITPTTQGDLKITPSLASVKVGEITSLLLKVHSTNPLPPSMQIVFPNGFGVSNSFCLKHSNFIQTLSCTQISTNTLKAQFIYLNSNLYETEFIVEELQNPLSTTQPEDLKITTLIDDCEVDSGLAQLEITTPGSLQVLIKISDEYINALSNYTLELTYKNPVPLTGYLSIALPAPITQTLSTYCIPSCEFSQNKIITVPSSTIQIISLKNSENSSIPLKLTISTYTSNLLIDTYTSGTFFHKCESDCLECTNSPNTCTLCGPNQFLFNSQCLLTCPLGFGYLNGTCSECQFQCKSCVSSYNYCTECFEGYSYNGECISACPVNTTLLINNTTCLDCIENCQTCENSIEQCTGCNQGTYLYLQQCLHNCPSGFTGIKGKCTECPCSSDKLNNSICDSECNVEACNYDNFECDSVFTIKALPSVTAAAGSTLVSSGNKFIGKGEMFGPTVAMWSVTQTCSWVSFAYKLSSVESKNRKLTEDLSTSQVIYLFMGIILLNLLMNVVFTLTYFGKVARSDATHFEWMKKHRAFVSVIGILSATFSFQIIRLTYTGPTCFSCCKSPFFRLSTIAVILLIYTVLYTLLILMPAIAILIYILFTYNSSHDIYPATIDCLLLTIMIALSTVFDLVKLSIQIGSERIKSSDSSSIVPNNEKIRPEDTIELKYEDQLNTERKLRETGMTEILEPENEDYEKGKLRIGSILDGNEGLEFLDFDQINGIVLGKQEHSSEVYALKYSEKEFNGFSGCKVIDFQDCKGNWAIGRTVDEDSLKDIQVFSEELDKVTAFHLKSGYKILLYKSFVGGYLNDLATDTPINRTLTQDEEKFLILDLEDPNYASLKCEDGLLRVFRSFDNSQLIDILPSTPENHEISFSQESKLFYKTEEESKENAKNDYHSILLQKNLKKNKLVPIEKTISGETQVSDPLNSH